jgi:predicted small metal-binding protein
MKKIIQCPCGSVIEGENDEDVVRRAQEHAKSTHNMDLTKEQALAMAKPA